MDADELRRVADIAADAETEDGADPLDEATWLALRHRSDEVAAWVEDDGFATLIHQDLSLVVRPAAREHGTGGSLLARVLAAYDGEIRAWSHVDHPAAATLAKRHGFEKVRELWVMRRSTAEPLAHMTPPESVNIRRYQPRDDADLLRINAAAFADHPEQGEMSAGDLAERMAEPWFDPAGLLVAIRDGQVVGFHWTKQHSVEEGEVYVVGVAPEAQGLGLGRVLTLAGLAHLTDRGAREVLLYVEADNERAIRLYSGLGFTHDPVDTHVMYHRR